MAPEVRSLISVHVSFMTAPRPSTWERLRCRNGPRLSQPESRQCHGQTRRLLSSSFSWQRRVGLERQPIDKCRERLRGLRPRVPREIPDRDQHGALTRRCGAGLDRPHRSLRIGRSGEIRTPDPLLPKQRPAAERVRERFKLDRTGARRLQGARPDRHHQPSPRAQVDPNARPAEASTARGNAEKASTIEPRRGG